MRIRIRIPKNVKEYFDQYGSLSYCVNKLMNELGENWIDAPAYGHRTSGEELSSTLVDITSPYFEAYRESFPARSPQISPSRMLIHAYNNDYCALQGWLKKSSLTPVLEQIAKLNKNDILSLIEYLKERYE